MMTVQSLHFYVLIILFAYTPNMGNTTLSEFQVDLYEHNENYSWHEHECLGRSLREKQFHFPWDGPPLYSVSSLPKGLDKETRLDKRSGIQSLGLKFAGSGFRGNRRGGSTRGRGRRGGRHCSSCVRIQKKSAFTLFQRGKDENPDCNQCRRRQSSEMFLIKIFLSMLSILVFEDHHSLSWDWKFFCR
ncbi:hypothetical protein NC652_015346 [Populus alba x Populus x berolinensis]|nr:hypothetical protein NC652_015346 [Populus alba x Populus x berolinensis]